MDISVTQGKGFPLFSSHLLPTTFSSSVTPFFGSVTQSPVLPPLTHLHSLAPTFTTLPVLLFFFLPSFFLCPSFSFRLVLQSPPPSCNSGSSATNGAEAARRIRATGKQATRHPYSIQAITLVSGPPPRHTDVTARRHRSPPELDSLGPTPHFPRYSSSRRDETRHDLGNPLCPPSSLRLPQHAVDITISFTYTRHTCPKWGQQ